MARRLKLLRIISFPIAQRNGRRHLNHRKIKKLTLDFKRPKEEDCVHGIHNKYIRS